MREFYEGKKVLITGGAGLVGQGLIRHLVPLGVDITATEHEVRRIEHPWRDRVRVVSGVDLARADLAELFAGQDIVFLAAAMVGNAALIHERPMDIAHWNMLLGLRSLRAAVHANVDRVCFFSSSYAYGDSDEPSREADTETVDVPEIHYGLGWMKRCLEKLCKAYQITSRTKFAIVRPTVAYGPNDKYDLEVCHVIPALVRKIAEGQKPLEVWGDGSEVRQFTYVDDLAQGALLATMGYACASPLNIATAEVNTVNDVWQNLFSIVGRSDEVRYLADKPRAINRRLVSTDLCFEKLNFRCETSLNDGLAKTLRWYQERK